MAVVAQPLRTLEGHTEQLFAVAISITGQRIISGAADNTCRIWEASTGSLLHTLTTPKWVMSVAITPDESKVFAGCADAAIYVWSASTGELLHTVKEHTSAVLSIDVSLDGARVVTSSADRTIRIWDVIGATCAPIRTLQGHSDWVRTVVFSPNGLRIVSASKDHTVRIWDTATGALQHTLQHHAETVYAVAVSADGRRVVSGAEDECACISDIATGALLHTFEGHTDDVRGVGMSSDGQLVVTGSTDNTLRVWDAQTQAVHTTLKGHTGGVHCIMLCPTSQTVVSGSADNTVRVWNLPMAVDGRPRNTDLVDGEQQYLTIRQFLDLPLGTPMVPETMFHLEVVGLAPPEAKGGDNITCDGYIGLAMDCATGEVLHSGPVRCTFGPEAYEDILHGFLAAYVAQSGVEHRPQVLTSSDPQLVDYCAPLFRGTGTNIKCVDMATVRGKDGALLQDILDPSMRSLAGRPDLGVQHNSEFVQLSSCNSIDCMKLHPSASLQRCGGCKLRYYCNRDCQAVHWKKGGHKFVCKKMRAAMEAAQAAAHAHSCGQGGH